MDILSITQIFIGNDLVDIIEINDKKYFIGANIADIIKRETFNLYRSLILKNVEILRCDQSILEFLISRGCLKKGCRSVTLIEYYQTLEAINLNEVLSPEELLISLKNKNRPQIKNPKKSKRPKNNDTQMLENWTFFACQKNIIYL